MSSQRPSIQFYPRDWLSHQGLAGCSLAARGLWMWCICIMHDAPVYGRLLNADGSPMAVDVLARRVGESHAHAKRLLEELLTNGVGRRAADGAVESPRMMRDEDRRNRRAAGGALGGNPALLGAAKDKGKVNLPANHGGTGDDNHRPTPAVASASALQEVVGEGDAAPATATGSLRERLEQTAALLRMYPEAEPLVRSLETEYSAADVERAAVDLAAKSTPFTPARFRNFVKVASQQRAERAERAPRSREGAEAVRPHLPCFDGAGERNKREWEQQRSQQSHPAAVEGWRLNG